MASSTNDARPAPSPESESADRRDSGLTPGWHFSIDRGGTFTDVVARDPLGSLRSLKLLSADPARYADAAAEGIRRLLADAPAEARRIAGVRMGTTVATNALLERRGEPTLLVITAGLKDALRIGTQQRPDLFALDIRLPEMLYVGVVEAVERIGADGTIVTPLDAARLDRDLRAARERGIESVAVVLMHGYRFTEHERQAGEIARRVGFRQISLSHEVSPLPKLVPRGDTTLVDAYLSPVLERHVSALKNELGRGLGSPPLLFMQSHGGLAAAPFFRGKDSILSGPAGGVVGMAATARAAGFPRVIGFDMGGTSTDVSLFAGELERTSSGTVAGVRVAAPMLRIHTVAAGGGSILEFESGRLQVGPGSAGALPGPACYRNGGPLTVTDANVLLGRIQPDFFPQSFGPDGRQPIDADVVRALFDALAKRVSDATGRRHDAARVASGCLRVAVERMANAIKKISIERGRDPADFALSSFGGAGGQHACQVADALGIETVFMHSLAGVLSAYGLGLADLRTIRQRAVGRRLEDAAVELPVLSARLEAEAAAELIAQGVEASRIRMRRRLGLKVEGADTVLPIEWSAADAAAATRAAFEEAHARHFGFAASDSALAVDWIEVEAIGETDKLEERPVPAQIGAPEPVARRPVWFDGVCIDAPVYRREDLGAGAVIGGPALVVEPYATVVVERGWRAAVDGFGHLVLARSTPRAASERVGTAADPVMLEVFNNLFMHIAEEMGVVLESTAHSVNIKERLDFSCAVFDAAGELVANAPHVPVHLGSMSDSVASVLARFGAEMRPGDAFVLNAPYGGGTHLPDVTVVSPVFGADGRRLDFVVASRAHHADIGGTTPGSMPPSSRSIDEEGVLIECRRLVSEGRFLADEIRALLRAGPYPARNPEQNLADLAAQLAANRKGAAELEALVARYGLEAVRAYMGHVKRNAEESVREVVALLGDGAWSTELDGGERVSVRVRVDRAAREARIDFTGTSGPSPTNFNAPTAIAKAAVLYVFRTLVRRSIPLNAGCLRPLSIELPPGSLLCPAYPAAVVAGNVETSQCIADALLAALGAAASSQGTMNNFTFGDEHHQYYETLCGGAGAGPNFDGASAVHTHMTNSRLTDPEVLETRFPVRLVRFEIRRGSGGAGRWRGGDGLVRELEFLAPLRCAVLSNRRRVPPFGLAGGGDGLAGKNYVIRATGEIEALGATAEAQLRAGDRFVIETPGGGGYGKGL
ncbi:MAG TPA: hydantoinase B/oxoprolinase family protein [Gammaproteobacteria bacterium]|nr:hydantoinase B/oxoprolinase family protein [Gammaproteobacteria bacterium]